MNKFILVVIALVLTACGGSVEPTPAPEASYCYASTGGCEYQWPIPQAQIDAHEIVCPPAEVIEADPTSARTCDQCFVAGTGLGQCAGSHVLWVGCTAPPAPECNPGGADGQFCCAQ